MGTQIFDFLSDSFLFDAANIENSFHSYTDASLEAELSKYREFVLSSNIVGEIKCDTDNNKTLSVFTGEKYTPIKQLKQSALYVEKYILNDPLFSQSYRGSTFNTVMKNYIGFNESGIDRVSLTKSVKYMKMLTPMVANDYVKFYPVDYYFEQPSQLPLNFPENYYKDLLPEDLLKWFHDNVIIKSISKKDGNWVVEESLFPSRGISIQFKDYEKYSAHIYHLFEQNILSYDENSGFFTSSQTLPECPPDKPMFNAWVFQSINRSSRDVFDNVFQQVKLATEFNASYIASNEFSFKLLQREVEVTEGIKEHTANQINRLDLPFIDDLDIETIMRIRNEDTDVFNVFRAELDSKFKELRLITDPHELKIKAENIFYDFQETQVAKIDQCIKTMKKKSFADFVILVGGLVCAVQTGGLSLLASATMAAKGYKTYLDFKDRVQQNPAFFMWKLLK